MNVHGIQCVPRGSTVCDISAVPKAGRMCAGFDLFLFPDIVYLYTLYNLI